MLRGPMAHATTRLARVIPNTVFCAERIRAPPCPRKGLRPPEAAGQLIG
jgi:hypothetical protein